MSDEWYTFSATTVALLFAVSAVSKAVGFNSFRAALRSFEVVPRSLVRPTAYSVLISEVVIVIALVIGGPAAVVGFALAIASLLVYSVLITFTLVKRRAVVCNCFGPSEQKVSPWDIGRNTSIIALSVLGLAMGNNAAWHISFELASFWLVVVAAVVVVMIVVNIREIGATLAKGF